MSAELLQAIEQVSREKNIEADIIISAVEEAIIAASKKIFKSDENFGARFNKANGSLEVWAIKEVVEEVTNPKRHIPLDEAALYYEGVEVGDTIEFQKDTTQLGRIAAHAAKQVIMQKVRDAEKDNIFNEFKGRLGEVITATVRRFERGNVILDLGANVEGIMPREEQSRTERYNQNDRTRVVIVGADRSTKEPQVKVSRADPRLLIKLFEMEVPEVYDETVVIKNAAREAGDRSKIAVYSKDPDVDPIGACVGMGGSRVRSIIRELKGERLDIIRYSDDISLFASNALSPAKINRVIISDPENRKLEVIVDEDQLSLAIGKRGQNVRLASRLCGWSIEVKTEEQMRREASADFERLVSIGESSKEAETEDSDIEETVEAATHDGEERVELSHLQGHDEEESVTPDMLAALGHDDDTDEAVKEDADTGHRHDDDEVVTAELAGEEEDEEETGVPLEHLDELSAEHREILQGYSISFIEDLLYTPREVLAKIPELKNEMDDIIQMAERYASQFGEEEDEEVDEES